MSAPELPFDARVTALLIAQDTFRDVRGRSHVIGIFDSVAAHRFPIDIPFAVYCALKGRRHGTYRVVVKLLDSLENTLVQSDPYTVELTPTKGHDLYMGFVVRFTAQGLYRLIAYLDGIPALEVPLAVRHTPSPPSHPPES
jgi:hypothetical protein